MKKIYGSAYAALLLLVGITTILRASNHISCSQVQLGNLFQQYATQYMKGLTGDTSINMDYLRKGFRNWASNADIGGGNSCKNGQDYQGIYSMVASKPDWSYYSLTSPSGAGLTVDTFIINGFPKGDTDTFYYVFKDGNAVSNRIVTATEVEFGSDGQDPNGIFFNKMPGDASPSLTEQNPSGASLINSGASGIMNTSGSSAYLLIAPICSGIPVDNRIAIFIQSEDPTGQNPGDTIVFANKYANGLQALQFDKARFFALIDKLNSKYNLGFNNSTAIMNVGLKLSFDAFNGDISLDGLTITYQNDPMQITVQNPERSYTSTWNLNNWLAASNQDRLTGYSESLLGIKTLTITKDQLAWLNDQSNGNVLLATRFLPPNYTMPDAPNKSCSESNPTGAIKRTPELIGKVAPK